MDSIMSYTRSVFCMLVFCVPASAARIYVDVDATGANNGMSWADAYTSLSTAITAASPGDRIWVAEGTYQPVSLKSGVKTYGGFQGKETSASQSNPKRYKTYISGSGAGRAVSSSGNDSGTVLRGFYIKDGFLNLANDYPEIGSGMYLENSSALIVRCVFTANTAEVLGGGVVIEQGSPTFVNCEFYGNDGGWSGGAVFSHKFAAPTFVNCLFYENQAWEGGAACIRSGAPTFTNCTFSDNRASNGGDPPAGRGGAFLDPMGHVVLRNCILWNNYGAFAGTNEIWNNPVVGGPTAATYSDIQGGWSGVGNLGANVDPLFVDPANDDYRLQAGSPCRDAGRNELLPADTADLTPNGNRTETLPKDLDLRDRVIGGTIDMGAFEWHP